jgi:hypothetical protein
MGAGYQMTADEIRDDQRWIANNREHLGDRAERISRALDIAREMVERREIDVALPILGAHVGGVEGD